MPSERPLTARLWRADAVLIGAAVICSLVADMNGGLPFLPDWAGPLVIVAVLGGGLLVSAVLVRLDAKRRLIALAALVLFAALAAPAVLP